MNGRVIFRRAGVFSVVYLFLLMLLISPSVTGCGESEIDLTGSTGLMVGAVYDDSFIPQNVLATAGEGKATISWDSVAGATSYNIYWSTSSGVTITSGAKIVGGVSPYAHTSLSVAGDVTYYYVVTAVMPSGESGISSEAYATPDIDTSVVPQNVAGVSGAGEVSISWDAVTEADSYNVYYGTSAGVTISGGTKVEGATSPHTITSLSEGNYYLIVTAVTARGESVGSTEVTAASALWKIVSALNTARDYLTSAAVNGKVYAIGGADYNNDTSAYAAAYDATEEYDPSANTWTAKTAMPTARSHFTSSAVSGKIYAIGGTDYTYSYRVVEEYDPATDIWVEKQIMPTFRYNLTSAVVDGKIYVIGGYDSTQLSTVEEYDPVANSWTTKASMPTARSFLTSSVVDGKIYVIGGSDGSYVQSKVEMYDPSTNTWSTKASLSTARSDMTSSVVDGKIYVFGGWDGNGESKVVEEYDPATNKWTTKSSMWTSKRSFTSSPLNGKIYLIGGWDGTKISKTVEVYAPSAD